ncbi:MAG: putative Ig domain-containing protein [Pseudomonadota bacterium]
MVPRKNPLLALCLVAATLNFLPFGAQAQTFDHVVAFGDSWTNPIANRNDGPSYAYQLTALLGLRFADMTNLSVDGATSGEINGQISAYINSGVDPDALHIYWAVGNDFTEQGAPDAATVVVQMAENAEAGVRALQQAGVQHMMIFGSIDNALRPLVINANAEEETTALAIDYNNRMLAALEGLGVRESYFNAFDAFHRLVQDPRFTNISQGCQDVNCPNRDVFVWWDDIHPTGAAHGVVAQIAFETLTAPGSSPRIVSTAPLVANINTTYNYDVAATDPDGGPLTYELTIAPDGMSINATTGLISFQPTVGQAGNHSVAVTVKDDTGRNDTQGYALAVEQQGNAAPSITSTAITNAQVGSAYTYTVTANDPNTGDAVTFSLTSAPGGMTIGSANGTINWTPAANQTGSQSVTVQATDNGGLSATQSFSITVSAAPGSGGGGGGGGTTTSGGGGGSPALPGLLLILIAVLRRRVADCKANSKLAATGGE